MRFECTDSRARQKRLRHVAAAAQRGLKLLEDEKDLTVVAPGIVLRLDINRTHLTGVLAELQVAAGANVRVVKSKAGRLE